MIFKNLGVESLHSLRLHPELSKKPLSQTKSKQKRYVRYLVLLLVLFGLSGHKLYKYSSVRSWQETLSVVVYPSNGDGLASTEAYIRSLSGRNVAEIAKFINSEALRYGVKDISAVDLQLSFEDFDSPPRLPRSRNVLSNIVWSLYFRSWAAFKLYSGTASVPDIALFVVFFDPDDSKRLDHSIGLAGSMIAMINAFADREYQGSNNVVITHELLHTVGATDKYDAETNLPLFPHGFANPRKSPLYPQNQAEIMGGRIPVGPHMAIMPRNLRQIVVGEGTAMELHWPAAKMR